MEQTFLLSLLENFCDVGVLEFFKTKPDQFVALAFHPLEV